MADLGITWNEGKPFIDSMKEKAYARGFITDDAEQARHGCNARQCCA